MRLRIEPLRKRHNRKGFRCGEPALDRWFEQHASRDERRDIARVFVAVDEIGVVGFYSLSMFTIELDELPATLARKLPNYRAIPAALIGRLARHERARGEGIGELLVADAVARVLGVAETIAAYAIVVDAKGASAVAFYESFGFIQFPSRQSKLFLLCDTARQARAHRDS